MRKSPGLTLQASLVQDNLPVEVLPRIFVGSVHAAFNVEALKQNCITHIINLAGNYATFPEDFTYLSISIRDKEYANLLSCLPVALLFVEAAIAQSADDSNGVDSNGVLIHCAGGRSRSPAIIMAYLMIKCGLTFDQALTRIRATRPIVAINPGFEAQLRSLEKSGGDIFSAHRLVLREKLTNSVQLRNDGLLDVKSSGKSHRSHHQNHYYSQCSPRTPKAADTNLHEDGNDERLGSACDDRGMLHSRVPSGFSLSSPYDSVKRQHFIPALRSMGTLYGCHSCGENLFCASAIVESCQSRERRRVVEPDAQVSGLAVEPAGSKIKRPLLAKLRLRSQNLGTNCLTRETSQIGTSKSNPTTPRVAILKSSHKTNERGSTQPSLQSPQPQPQNVCELKKSDSTCNLTNRSHEKKKYDGFWRSLASLKPSSKRTSKEPASGSDQETQKKAILSPTTIAIDLSTDEKHDGEAHAEFVKQNSILWGQRVAQLGQSWVSSPSSQRIPVEGGFSEVFTAQLNALMAHDELAIELLEAADNWCLEPHYWVGGVDLTEDSGAIICPNDLCGVKLGQWAWEGLPCACGCGHVVAPAFSIHKSSVRKLGNVVNPPAQPRESDRVMR